MKKFFWKDTSGRGFTNTFTEKDLAKIFKEEEDTNWDGETASEWAEEAEVGDKWLNAANEITRVD